MENRFGFLKYITNFGKGGEKGPTVEPEQIIQIDEAALEPLIKREQVFEVTEEVLEKAGKLTEPYFAECVRAVKDTKAMFSPVDGEWLRTPQERLAYIEKLSNLSPLELKWYIAHVNVTYDYKNFGKNFVSTELIPKALKENKTFGELPLEIHKFQMMGSCEQHQFLKNDQLNMAGMFRERRVFIGFYTPPNTDKVPVLMDKLSLQIETFSQQLENLRSTVDEKTFETRVIEFASFVLCRVTDIHPFLDGNGRTARSLYEYIVVKFLGPDNKYKSFSPGGGLTRDLNDLQREMQFRFENGQTRLASSPTGQHLLGEVTLERHLEQTSIEEEVFSDEMVQKFAQIIRKYIDREQYLFKL